MAIARIDRLDDAVGAGVERLVLAHHRRRLRRHGWGYVYDPPGHGLWCDGDPPPRDGNTLDVLVDGETALGRLQEEILAAKESVHLAGWHFDPSFRLVAGGPTLRELLGEVAKHVDVRVLAWAGAPLPLFTPSRSEVREARDRLVSATKIRMALDSRERPMHCHHEKLAVIDGRVAFVGGIDLTGLEGNRLDSSEHGARGSLGWHDASTCLEGPIVGDVASHFALRWHEVTGERLPASNRLLQPGDVTAQFVRTVPNNVYEALPNGDFRILEAYTRAFRSAEKSVYIENQFLWSSELVQILTDKLRNPPSDEFHVVILLPARPNNGGDDTRGQLGLLIDADREDRFLACTLFQPDHVQQVYVHAKVCVVDDRWLVVGSANLNEHSLYNDTEACVITCDEQLARDTRLALWREHLQHDEPTFATWRERAEDDGYHRVAPLPHLSRRIRRFLGPINGLLVDG